MKSTVFAKKRDAINARLRKARPANKRNSGGGADIAGGGEPGESLCFSIVTDERTLDLEADSQRTRDLWVAGIEALVLEALSGGKGEGAGAAATGQEGTSPARSPGKRGSREGPIVEQPIEDFNNVLAQKRSALEHKETERQAAFNKNKAGRDKLRDVRGRASSAGRKEDASDA